MTRILAIDPGMSGGLAYLGASGIILNSMPDTDQDISILVSDRLAISDVVYIEKVGGYVGGKGAPGSSMFNFGFNTGFLHGLIAASKTLGVGNKATHGTKWKAHLKGIAQQRQPRQVITLKTADAVLILEHAMISEGLK